MKLWRGMLVAGLLAVATNRAAARWEDYLDSFGGTAWSPNGEWLAFNPPNQNELFVISLRTGKSFLLRPVGQLAIDTTGVFSPEAPVRLDPKTRQAGKEMAATARMIPSRGEGRLRPLAWAADSRLLAYWIGRRVWGILDAPEAQIIRYSGEGEFLPWWRGEDLSVEYQLLAATKDDPAQFHLRVQRRDGKIVRQVVFANDREIRAMTVFRYRGVHLLSPDWKRLAYPRHTEAGWVLYQEPVAGDAPPVALTQPTREPPAEWRFSRDGEQLAIIESGETLVVGPVADWSRAERLPFSNIAGALRWSPDGRFLACQDKQQLFLLAREEHGERYVGDFMLVSENCAPRVWGWRGTKLLIGDAKPTPTNISVIDTERLGRAMPLVKGREWGSTPREISISPDGATLAVLVTEFDYEGRSELRLWSIALEPDATWKLLHTFRP